MQRLDGKKLQKIFFNEIKYIISLLDIKPKLFIISIGEQFVNQIYLKQIQKMCNEVGFECESVFFEAITESRLLNLIETKNVDPDITSILVLAPLPFYLDENKIYNHILPRKDVEGLSFQNQIRRINGDFLFVPCTASSIISLLKFHNIDVEEKTVIIINRSKRIGMPLFSYFLDNNCTVTMMHSKTKNYENILKTADIVITAVGKGTFIDSDSLKKGCTVIDLGMFEENGELVGDVLLKEENSIQNYLCHTGGVGPVTVACLAQNILNSYYLSLEDK